MKRLAFCILSLLIAFSLIGCANVSINDNSKAMLKFICGDKNIAQELTVEETQKVENIFAGQSLYSETLSCGFSENVSISFGEQVFAIACDNCAIVFDSECGQYFSITEQDREYIETIFEKYGGYFPCV